ncbi:MAG: hypothetical protein OEN50_11365 [Deltaproteobacteria bacterium]|nr:hypothetical protein [Deltaproteobacteria bacterium]
MTDHGRIWTGEEVRPLLLDALDERLQRYRLVQPRLERALARSLERCRAATKRPRYRQLANPP